MTRPVREQREQVREEGVVKFFNDTKGWGFIIRDSDNSEIFVHYSEVEKGRKGRKTLYEGQRVSFVVGNNGKGPCAMDVRTGH